MKAGWIGLGAMGWPMAGHLHDNGYLAAVWNRTSDKAREFTRQRSDVEGAPSPAELAESVDVIAVCVSADADLAAVIDTMQPVLRPGQIVIDHSTVSPATAREQAAVLAEREVALLDAPVTGGVEGARNGTLAVMAGGERDAFERVREMMAVYARVIHHLGPVGKGQSGKAVNQMMVAGIAEAVCESLALMERLDLPAGPMLELLGSGAAGNWFLDKRGRTMLDDSFETGFDPKLLLKDLGICRDLCHEAGFQSAVVGQAVADYTRLIETGDQGRDISALIRLKKGEKTRRD